MTACLPPFSRRQPSIIQLTNREIELLTSLTPMAASSPAAWIVLFIAVGIAAAPSSSASLLPPGVDYFSCWGTFSSVVGCSAKVVVPAPGSVQLLLSPACCKFAVEVERTCFLGTFRNFPYASGADEFVRRICGSSAGLPPATAPAPAPALNA